MYTSAWIFPALILFGGIVTLIRDRNKPVKAAPGDEGIQSYGMGKARSQQSAYSRSILPL